MVNKHVKICPTSLVAREIKSKLQNPLGWLLQKTKQQQENKCWQGYRESGILVHCWWEQTGAAAVENSLAVPQKIKHRISI